ncbi:hypothetical protein GGI11_006723 [Coemansia sp. RSA 2049]|nr:hypothetical protein GGI11_006723 [Coemansia sp. RSA 2049]KAJ2513843.1 hypothetical protein H4217_006095 [Coemansia sp. RSA 1939]KAJ2604602.1 hypothetical protein EV177_006362 [Coemansia sp. RSA 1804]KAJ2679223.1 hypothetical protein GGH99_005569 [Coemansia sp. RSA 1285]
MSENSSHADTIAAGLQRQLDEIYSMIQNKSIATAPPQSTDDDNNNSNNGTSGVDKEKQEQQSEIEKLNNRIKHLVRALDAKDREIQQLRKEKRM